jgi:alkylation response protein AidB-like acyl-CoA dehydrogenase
MREDVLIARARDLVPDLRRRARACEERRSLPLETVADFRAAGFPRVLQPTRFGGYELGLASLVAILREVGRGCGSSAWCLALFATHNRLVGLFDERAQREVFGDDGDALIAAIYTPSGTAAPIGTEPGRGFRVTGRWRFASGCDHGTWVAVAARVQPSAGPIADIRTFLIPAGDFGIEDTWFAAGLRGTGSKDVVVNDVFVPTHRVVSFVDVVRGSSPGVAVNRSSLFRLPLFPVLALVAGGPALGLAHGAIDAFRELEAGRAAGHGRATHPIGPARLAEATAGVEAAELYLQRGVDDLTRRVAAGEYLTRGQRARYRLDGAWVVAACLRAVDGLFRASGASALFDASPLQRAFRDLHAMAAHNLLQLDAAADLFGRLDLGLSPPSDPLL